MNADTAPANEPIARIVAMTGWRHRNVGAKSEYSQLHAVHARLADDMIHSENLTFRRSREQEPQAFANRARNARVLEPVVSH